MTGSIDDEHGYGHTTLMVNNGRMATYDWPVEHRQVEEHRETRRTTVARRMLTIVNPRGGRRRGARVFAAVKPVLERAGIELETHESTHAGHASELVRSRTLAEFDGICVVGGDGTVHEVVQGLMSLPAKDRVPLALVPAGTGNTLHHELGCEDPVAAVERAIAGRTHSVDVAHVSTPSGAFYCVNIVGFGAVVDINRTAERLRWIGRARYAMAALWHILRPSPRRVQLKLDDHDLEGEFLFVLGCNTKSTGTNMQLAPTASLDDGLIDVVLLRDTSRLNILSVFFKSLTGAHLSLPCIECHQVRSFSLTTDASESINLDGESAGTSPFTVKVLKNSIEVFR